MNYSSHTNAAKLLCAAMAVALGVALSAPTAFALNYNVTDLGTLGGTFGFANGINNHGQVVGEASRPDGVARPVLWQNGQTIDLGTFGGANGKAFDINDSGVIVGRAATSVGRLRPFVMDYANGGPMREIPPLAGAVPASNTQDGTAYGINSSGLMLIRLFQQATISCGYA